MILLSAAWVHLDFQKDWQTKIILDYVCMYILYTYILLYMIISHIMYINYSVYRYITILHPPRNSCALPSFLPYKKPHTHRNNMGAFLLPSNGCKPPCASRVSTKCVRQLLKKTLSLSALEIWTWISSSHFSMRKF